MSRRHELPPILDLIHQDAGRALQDFCGYRDLVKPPSVFRSGQLSKEFTTSRSPVDVYIASLVQQNTGAYKVAGALNKFLHLTPEERRRGVIAASAGNFGAAVSFLAHHFNTPAEIVMPEGTPDVKQDNVKDMGEGSVDVTLHGDVYDDACEYAISRAKKNGVTFLHPFNDRQVIAGQGTIALDILNKLGNRPDAMFFPVGGGGLGAGLASVMTVRSPQTSLIGVEPENADSMGRALTAGRVVSIENGFDNRVDGAATRAVGDTTLRVFKAAQVDCISVTYSKIVEATHFLRESGESDLQVEFAGALALAGARKLLKKQHGFRTICLVLSGGNLSEERYRQEVAATNPQVIYA